MMEMFQDLLIASLVNIGLVGKSNKNMPVHVLNFILSLGFLCLMIGFIIYLIILTAK